LKHSFTYAQIWAFYLEKGRELTVQIANYINTYRYSNSTKEASEPIINIDLFDTILPITLVPSMTHLHLAQAFAKVKSPRSV